LCSTSKLYTWTTNGKYAQSIDPVSNLVVTTVARVCMSV